MLEGGRDSRADGANGHLVPGRDDLGARVGRLEHETRQLKQALGSYAVIDQAIGVVIALGSLHPEQGFEVLRTVAQSTHVEMQDEQIVAFVHRQAADRGSPHSTERGPGQGRNRLKQGCTSLTGLNGPGLRPLEPSVMRPARGRVRVVAAWSPLPSFPRSTPCPDATPSSAACTIWAWRHGSAAP
ncbi:ANTAR domain-containing protein [Streptomyces sp. 1222.5]|uniref:ANTAR domain-containing protein n=1 Tax=Streptomyces sp. 1222.5 TaxID=1881026 RepID=UPI003EB97532